MKIPLRYQMSEYDCGSTALFDGITTREGSPL